MLFGMKCDRCGKEWHSVHLQKTHDGKICPYCQLGLAETLEGVGDEDT